MARSGDELIATGRQSSRAPTQYDYDANDCFTSLFFQGTGIHNRTFNVSGTDDLVWGANGEDIFASYHGNARGRFVVNWMTGEIEDLTTPAHEDPEEPVEVDSSNVVSSSSAVVAMIAALITAVFL